VRDEGLSATTRIIRFEKDQQKKEKPDYEIKTSPGGALYKKGLRMSSFSLLKCLAGSGKPGKLSDKDGGGDRNNYHREKANSRELLYKEESRTNLRELQWGGAFERGKKRPLRRLVNPVLFEDSNTDPKSGKKGGYKD